MNMLKSCANQVFYQIVGHWKDVNLSISDAEYAVSNDGVPLFQKILNKWNHVHPKLKP